ncbi:ICL domain-containing protein [Puccinia sorghi]|uniref:methylisocitrate lyase n=1 Tax=Puccinia sorghi TaxID=27349 RepID=A0A0L6V8F1_9BASI|nr:ICL domain-containing protein [Puccinia sorghi]
MGDVICRNLAYNLSPSFHWSAHGFSEQALKSYVWGLSQLGFNLHLISLARLHVTAMMMGEEREETYRRNGGDRTTGANFQGGGRAGVRETDPGAVASSLSLSRSLSYVDGCAHLLNLGVCLVSIYIAVAAGSLATGADSPENAFASW